MSLPLKEQSTAGYVKSIKSISKVLEVNNDNKDAI